MRTLGKICPTAAISKPKLGTKNWDQHIQNGNSLGGDSSVGDFLLQWKCGRGERVPGVPQLSLGIMSYKPGMCQSPIPQKCSKHAENAFVDGVVFYQSVVLVRVCLTTSLSWLYFLEIRFL
jgi:hypothetical protein